jgi:hypothetical protein
LDVVAELHHDDVGHGVAVSLGATLRISLGPADAEDVDGAAVPSEEAPVVETVSVYPSVEAFRGSQRELHAVFVAHLTDYVRNKKSGTGQMFLLRRIYMSSFTIETVAVQALSADRSFVKVEVAVVVEESSAGHVQVSGLAVAQFAVIAFAFQCSFGVSGKKRHSGVPSGSWSYL